MGIQQKSLAVIFRAIQPEMLYTGILSADNWSLDRNTLSAANIPGNVFVDLANRLFPGCSFEELQNIHRIEQERMAKLPNGEETLPSVFNLLVWMGHRVLRQRGSGLVYDFTQALAWRTVYQDLGQDLLTTAFLAYHDLYHGNSPRTAFIWEPILKSDNPRLRTLLSEGIAENHCHLGGTTQNFPLSWACLMNDPWAITAAAEMLTENLHSHESRGISGNVWSWEKRLTWAAYLRLELFKILEGAEPASLDMEAQLFHTFAYLSKELATLRFSCGAAVKVKNEAPFVLDYALRICDCTDWLEKEHNRLLSGERSFLYRCFIACFDGTFDEMQQSWFYFYLLIKSNFRAEIVQVNEQPGFYNFKRYQDRKDYIYDRYPGYRAEALRLSVNASQASQHITSFEARIAPKPSPEDMYKKISSNDGYIEDAGGLGQDFRLYYVYHFIKAPERESLDEDWPKLVRPRNNAQREAVKQEAVAISRLLRGYPEMCERILGIDAANLEIGCRPEVFATAFRYLTDLSAYRQSQGFLDRTATPHLHLTYHVGEDFLDIADGLRAIDEAVEFLRLRRGDRLGHALALGVDPQIHYRFKTWRIVLPSQDLLDNLVWLLFRSQEIGVAIEPQLRARLQTQAEELFYKIYGEVFQDIGYVSLYTYFRAMHLRGDDPALYRTTSYQKPTCFRVHVYDAYRENPRPGLGACRENQGTAKLYHAYHYDPEVRSAGAQMEEFEIDDAYIRLIRAMQDRLSRYIGNLGIGIECNPTSNYLIGTFRRYDKHPIFRFNNANLVTVSGAANDSPQLSVSINTDDLGVFDTSLENEYGILAAALEKAVDENGEPQYTRSSIYCYLDSVRKMGIEQSFLFQEQRFPHNIM